jgi:GT2 family glycosyltransferase
LNYERSDLTLECVRSIIDKAESPVVVVIVDNHSRSDDYRALMRGVEELDAASRQNVLHLVRAERNAGFASGCNIGIRLLSERADLEWIWLLNNDTTLLTEGFVGHVENFFAAQDAPVIASTRVIDKASGRDWFQGGAFYPALAWVKHVDAEKFSRVRHPFLSGCSLILSKAVISLVGYLDERYFMYWEDVEYSVRAQRRGVRVALIDDVRVEHLGAGTTGLGNPMAYGQISNVFLLLADHFPTWMQLSARVVLTLKGVALTVVRGRVIGRTYLTSVWRASGATRPPYGARR